MTVGVSGYDGGGTGMTVGVSEHDGGGIHDQSVAPTHFDRLAPPTVTSTPTISRSSLFHSVSASLNGFQQGSVSGLTDHVKDPRRINRVHRRNVFPLQCSYAINPGVQRLQR